MSCAWVGWAKQNGVGPWSKNEHGLSDADLKELEREIGDLRHRFPDGAKRKRKPRKKRR